MWHFLFPSTAAPLCWQAIDTEKRGYVDADYLSELLSGDVGTAFRDKELMGASPAANLHAPVRAWRSLLVNRALLLHPPCPRQPSLEPQKTWSLVACTMRTTSPCC